MILGSGLHRRQGSNLNRVGMMYQPPHAYALPGVGFHRVASLIEGQCPFQIHRVRTSVLFVISCAMPCLTLKGEFS